MVMVRMIKKDNYVDGDSTSDDTEYGNDDCNKNGHYTAHRAVVRSVSSY